MGLKNTMSKVKGKLSLVKCNYNSNRPSSLWNVILNAPLANLLGIEIIAEGVLHTTKHLPSFVICYLLLSVHMSILTCPLINLFVVEC